VPAVTSGDAWQPEQYHRFRAERSQPFFDLLGLVEREHQPHLGPRLVDLGCGTGELTAEAHRMLDARVTVGIDNSAAMLERAASYSSPRLTFEAGDIGAFPGANPRAAAADLFDVVISNAALQWLPDHPAVLARGSGALAGHGQLAVQVPANADHPAHLLASEVAGEPEFADAFAASGPGGPPPDPVLGVLAPEAYAQVLDGLGFARQHVRLQVYGHHLASTAEVVEWVKGTSLTRFRARLAPADFDRFVARYRERLLETLGDRRPFLYPFKRILLWGRR
jgi:trans-aconitate 2-methyltransferase